MTSLRELIDAAAENGATVPAEVAVFVALEVAERLAEHPTRIAPSFVEVSGRGEVTVASTSTASVPDAMRAVGRLLSEMVAGESGIVPPGLAEVVRRTTDGGADAYADLSGLQRDLEAYLVPLERTAARRVLARYVVDVLPGEAGEASAEATQDGSDLEFVKDAPDPLDDLLAGLTMDSSVIAVSSPAPDPLAATTPPMDEEPASVEASPSVPAEASPSVPDVGSLLDSLDEPAPPAVDPPTDLEAAPVPPIDAPAPEPSRPVPIVSTAPPRGAGSSASSVPLVLPDVAEPRPRRGFGVLLATVLMLLAAFFLVLYKERPELFGGTPAVASTRRTPATAEAPRRLEYGTLRVTSTPPGAEVLLFVGRGPVEFTHLQVGVAHEFVAISDDGRVARGLVPADARFEPHRGGADPVQTELAIQLPPDEAPWPGTNLPHAAPGEGSGQYGTVRVVTNPLGAKVYYVAGFTPTPPISNLRLDEAYELLVVKEGHAHERVLVGRSDWHKAEGSDDFTHEAAVTLTPDEPEPTTHRHHRRRRHR